MMKPSFEELVEIHYRAMRGMPLTLEETQWMEWLKKHPEGEDGVIDENELREYGFYEFRLGRAWINFNDRHFPDENNSKRRWIRTRFYEEINYVNLKVGFAAIILAFASVVIWPYLFDKEIKKEIVTSVLRIDTTMSPNDSSVYIVTTEKNRMPIPYDQTGLILVQGETKIEGLEPGYIAYSAGSVAAPASDLYNTIQVPFKKRYKVKLPDSTIVWLNAFSSLRFPVDFTDSVRRVELIGEAYFEVNKNHSKPFVVHSNTISVRVLGTKFNIKENKTEGESTVSLKEGAVEIDRNNEHLLLKPGQQVMITKGVVKRRTKVDMDEVLAWKNGLFDYHSAPFNLIIEDIASWYGYSVKYEGEIPKFRFTLDKIPRNWSLKDVLGPIINTHSVDFDFQEVGHNKVITVIFKK